MAGDVAEWNGFLHGPPPPLELLKASRVRFWTIADKAEVPRRRSDTISEYFSRKKQYRAFIDVLRRVHALGNLLSSTVTAFLQRAMEEAMTLKPQIFPKVRAGIAATILVAMASPLPAMAGQFVFNTGNPDGLMATATRPASAGKFEIEIGDDFVLTRPPVTRSPAMYRRLNMLAAHVPLPFLFAGSKQVDAGQRLIHFLGSEAAEAAIRRSGMDPAKS